MVCEQEERDLRVSAALEVRTGMKWRADRAVELAGSSQGGRLTWGLRQQGEAAQSLADKDGECAQAQCIA